MTLQVTDLRIEIGARVLLDDATFHVADGERVALVGPNGAGKTTLLRTLAGRNPAAAGTVRLPERVGWLAQETTLDDSQPGFDELLTYDHLLAASSLTAMGEELLSAQEAIEKAAVSEDPDALDRAVHHYSALEERFRFRGGYSLETGAEGMAASLGLDEEALLRPVSALSGGQRRRLELGRLLLAGGDLLILDEPTNHLDAEAKEFVMDFLRTSGSAVLVVSHDIELMSESIDRVFALENARLEVYRGTYAEFLRKRAHREAALAREAANAQKEIARLQRTADKFRQGNASAARRRKSLERQIGRIADQQASALPPVRRRAVKVRFPEPARAGDIVLTLRDLAKRFDGTEVFAGVTCTVDRGEVFLVVGPNGAGKTTLLRTVAGVYRPDEGQVGFGANVTVGFYAQEHEDIRPGHTVLALMQESSAPGLTVSELRGILSHFGLTGDVAGQEAATLSGGEKTKLSLARLVAGKANLLLLDEPTNNLDPGSREAVLAALQHFTGTVVLVSHDVDFVTQLAPKHAIVLPAGKVLPFDERMLRLVPQTEPAVPQGARKGA